MEAGVEVPDVIFEVFHLQLERVLLEGLVGHVKLVGPVLEQKTD
jgi:hypothetical protein